MDRKKLGQIIAIWGLSQEEKFDRTPYDRFFELLPVFVSTIKESRRWVGDTLMSDWSTSALSEQERKWAKKGWELCIEKAYCLDVNIPRQVAVWVDEWHKDQQTWGYYVYEQQRVDETWYNPCWYPIEPLGNNLDKGFFMLPKKGANTWKSALQKAGRSPNIPKEYVQYAAISGIDPYRNSEDSVNRWHEANFTKIPPLEMVCGAYIRPVSKQSEKIDFSGISHWIKD